MRVDLERCPPPFQKPMKIFHMNICELLVSNPKSNHFYWALFWVGVIYLILRFETHLVSLRMLKLHHLFVLLGRGISGRTECILQTAWFSWLVFTDGDLPTLAEIMATARGQLKPGRFQTFQKRDFVGCELCRGVEEIKVYWRREILIACQGIRLYIYSTSFGPWISGFVPEIAAFHGQHLCFFFMFASNIIQFDAPQRLVLLVPSKTAQPAKGYGASNLGVFGVFAQRGSSQAVNEWEEKRKVLMYIYWWWNVIRDLDGKTRLVPWLLWLWWWLLAAKISNTSPTEIDVEGKVGRMPRMSRKLGSFFEDHSPGSFFTQQQRLGKNEPLIVTITIEQERCA